MGHELARRFSGFPLLRLPGAEAGVSECARDPDVSWGCRLAPHLLYLALSEAAAGSGKGGPGPA